ncbi:MAG: hypothetical protein KC656_07465 [Myxococcales bacterium]|nr:hypothetical protein [Myxococcales bacterium]
MSVVAALEALPTTGLTIKALEALDFVVPGEWSNTTRFEGVVTEVADLHNPVVLQIVRARALALEASDPRYGQALQVYQLVDTVDQVAAGAAVASKVGGLLGSFGGIGDLIGKVTPKPETTQCVDAGVKLVAELLAFGLMNGMPTADPDGLARFTGALADYGRYDLMRISAWVVYDGLLPLGPQFLPKMIGTFTEAANSDMLTNNPVFRTLGGKLPGSTSADKRDFIVKTLNSTGDWVGRFVDEKGLTHDKVMGRLQGVLSLAGGSGDYVAAAIDAGTSYTAHTGTQTVARALAKHAVHQMRDEAWETWLKTLGGR